MATTTSISTTYAGEKAAGYIQASLLSGSTLANDLITLVPNIKYKSVLKTGATSDDLVKNASCDFSATSTLTLAERVLQPEEFQVNLQLCKKDFRSDWDAAQMGISVHDNIPNSFADFLIAHVADKIAQRIETNIWNGTNATAGQFDGFFNLLSADSDVSDISGTTSTAANVIDEMGKVVNAIPSAVYGNEDLYLYVSSNLARNYIRALGGFGASGLGAAGIDNKGTTWFTNGALSFDGIPVVVAKGMGDNTMIAARKSNLYFGTGLLNDTNEVKVIDMADYDGSQNVRVVVRFTANVIHGFGGDIVLYHPTV